MKNNPFLRESLREEDMKEIGPLLEKLADMSALPPGRNINYGSGRTLARGAIIGGAASLMGANPYAAVPIATAADFIAGNLLMTKSGRSMVKAVLEMKAYSPSQKLNIINGMGLLAERGINKAME